MLDLESRARRYAERLTLRAGHHYLRRLPTPQLDFNLRGTNAGEAQPRQWLIRLNRDLLARYGLTFIEETVPHEVAHLVANRVYGRRISPHGAEWREVMALFGADPSRCHNFEVVPTRRLRTFLYRCGCREHWLTSIRHNRALRGTGYLCRSCRRPLRKS